MLLTYEELKSKGAISYQDLEKKRKKGKSKSKKGFVIALIIELITIWFSIMLFKASHPFWVIVVFIVGTITFLVIWISVNSSATKSLKKEMYNSILKSVDESLNYEKSEDFHERIMKEVHFLLPIPGSNIDDVFSGKLQNNNFVISDINIVSGNNNSLIGAISKLYFKTALPDIYVFSRTFNAQSLVDSNKKLFEIFTMNNEFQEKFIILSEDNQACTAIFNSTFTEYLLKLNKEDRLIFKITSDGIMFLSDTEMTMFEIFLSNKINDKVLSSFYSQFKKQYDIIENLYSFIKKGFGTDAINNQFNEDEPPPAPPM